jgi:hypothetical protein
LIGDIAAGMTEPELSQIVGTSCSLQLGGAKSAKTMCSCSRHIEAQLLRLRTQAAVVHVVGIARQSDPRFQKKLRNSRIKTNDALVRIGLQAADNLVIAFTCWRT